jgi:hypothetical protein
MNGRKFTAVNTGGSVLRSQLLLVGLIALTAMCAAHAQDPDSEMNAHRERVRQREAERLQEELKGLTPAEIQRRQQIESLLRSSMRHIDGKQTPDLVPQHIRMQHFFHGYEQGMYASMLAPELSTRSSSAEGFRSKAARGVAEGDQAL